jgi:cell division cycle protein 20 (cofactor of APC complex)
MISEKSMRCIPQFPEKILDAPDLVDDYYLNLLDWSCDNILAVCLAQTVYLWNANTGDIQLLYETESDDDIVTSVSWMKKSTVLAVGTSNKTTILFDTIKYEKIREFS